MASRGPLGGDQPRGEVEVVVVVVVVWR
ncbi:hypothetical protein E2C01_073682 [Portunus trituberculatus]|uniref:Uncharacterized protein n=1 Tax=Portunus trituberculatus TaxID=210409 RepID=A0A5B7IB81_PORTR|nr:hypothetical protein [Portunus trituberculatus]